METCLLLYIIVQLKCPYILCSILCRDSYPTVPMITYCFEFKPDRPTFHSITMVRLPT